MNTKGVWGMVWVATTGCSALKDVNLLSIEDDLQLGAELHAEILSDPETYPILDESEYAEAYGHLFRIRDEVLASEEVEHLDDFEWQTFLIHDDATLNAFAAPGGYLYVYTGLLRYLDAEDHFAGVMGHEVAHADQRHGTEQLTKVYGMQVVLSVILGGEPGLAAQLATGLVAMQFSRDHEAEADEYSVVYLCESLYAADGAAGFFDKLLEEGSFEIPAFLSSHPSSESRVEDIRALAGDLGCPTTLSGSPEWQAFQDALPPVE